MKLTDILRRLRGLKNDYRVLLFDELVERLGGEKPRTILEIGPRDGLDTRRLLTLEPERLVLVDLPVQEENIRTWLARMDASRIDLRIGNMMYDACFQADESFDLIWCTGVLYHNPEQLRMIRMLFDRLKPNGFLVIESSTARRSRHNADDNVVEIWYPPESNPQSGMYRVAENVTHLPSRKAIWSWLSMVGFDDIRLSECFRRSYPHLAKVRAAFVCRKPVTPVAQTYYNHAGLNYPVGRAL